MSRANLVRSDQLPDWPQLFDEYLVDDEEQRVARVEVYGVTLRMVIMRERSCCTRRKSSTATSNQASQSVGGSGTRTDADSLPQLVCALRTRSREIRCASQTSKRR